MNTQPLENYFSPFLLQSGLVALLLILAFDITGHAFRKLFRKNDDPTGLGTEEIRVVDWIIGVGLFVALWYPLAFILKPTTLPVSISLLVGSLIGVKFIGARAYVDSLKVLTDAVKSACPLFLIMLPFIPVLFIRLSVISNSGDETGYHFVSPGFIEHYFDWPKLSMPGGVFEMVPRLIDSLYVVLFSASKTYSIVRFIQTLIFISMLTSMFLFLAKSFSKSAAVIFSFVYLGMQNLELGFILNVGLVDSSNAAFIALGMLFLIRLILNESLDDLYSSTLFFAMALGTKYSGLTTFLAMVVVLIAYVGLNPSLRAKILRPKPLFVASGIFVLFGGYWYLKNLWTTGNPIFPFCVPKVQLFENCQYSKGFFGTWTSPVTFAGIPELIRALFSGNKYLFLVPLTLAGVSFLKYQRNARLIFGAILLIVFFDFAMLKFSSGFFLRYHMHIQLITVVAVAIGIGALYLRSSQKIQRAILLGFALFVAPQFASHIKEAYRLINMTDVRYSFGQIGVMEWIKEKNPSFYDVIEWCGQNPEKDEPIYVTAYEREIRWPSSGDLTTPFYLRCQMADFYFKGKTKEEHLQEAIDRKLQFHFISPYTCENAVIKTQDTDEPGHISLRHQNHHMVCLSQQVLPHLFYFDYKNHVTN